MENTGIFGLMLSMVSACYGLLIIVFTIGVTRLLCRKRNKRPQPAGLVSVIIPVRNEALNILRILMETAQQDFPGAAMEVIVTDDFSEDETMAIAAQFAKSHPGFPLMLVSPYHFAEQQVPGKKSAIARAIGVAKGEILLFTDADTSRGTGWISAMVAGFSSPGIQMVLGPVCFSNAKNLLQKIQVLEFFGLMGVTAGSAALGYPVMCNGANLAYRRNAFLQSGGFSGNLNYISGDDQFLMSSIRRHYGKGSQVFNADSSAAVSTEPEATLAGFLHQRFRWVSKSRGYRDPVVILVGAVTYLTHLLLLAGVVYGIFCPPTLLLPVIIWLGKILLEYPMVWLTGRFFGNRKLWGYYFIAQVFQLAYVPLTGLLGLIVPYRWKGRKG